MRTAVFVALGNLSADVTLYSALLRALREDPSYAVQAAAAKGLGKSRLAPSIRRPPGEVQKQPEKHLMQGILAGLVATNDPRAVPILLAQAQPWIPERIRMSALAGLGSMKEEVGQNDLQQLISVVRAALHDPFYLTKEAGEQLCGNF